MKGNNMNKIMALGMLTVIGIGSYAQAMTSEERKQLEMERVARQTDKLLLELNKAMTSKNIKWLTDNKHMLISLKVISQERFQQMIDQLTLEIQRGELTQKREKASSEISSEDEALRALAAKRYKNHLRDEYEQAILTGNIVWFKKNRELLLTKHIALENELDPLIEALESPIKEKERAEECQKEREIVARQTCMSRMAEAKSAQEATRRGLAWLYEQLAGKDANGEALKALADIQDLSEFFDHLNELAQRPKMMETIGNELQQLRGHMLYRVWETPQQLATSPDTALQAFRNAATLHDINAMINLYRDILKKNSNQSTVLGIIYDIYTNAMDRQDIQALIDLYLYFFKGSDQEATALLLLNEFTQQLIQRRDKEGLQRLLLCFENTPYEQDAKGAIASLALEMGQPSGSITPADTSSQSPKHILYEEWQAACINQNLGRLLELHDEVIKLDIVAEDIADAIIQSLMQ